MLRPLTTGEIESVVHEKILAILRERVGEVPAVRGSDNLNATLGLSSLDLAFLVAELEADLGLDPFSKLIAITSVRSVDDLVKAYCNAAFPQPASEPVDQAVAAAMQRVGIRRARRKRP
jgi:acyl carrier protein